MDPSANVVVEQSYSLACPSLAPDFSAGHLLDALPWGVLVLDEQRRIRCVNQQAAQWCGTLPETLFGRPLLEAGLPLALRAALLQLLEPGAAQPREVYLPQPERWITLSATRQPSGWVLYAHDVTPQKQREQQYQTLADNTPDVLTRWTPDLRLGYANAAFTAKTGQPVNALLGRTFAEMGASADITGPYMAALQRVFDTGQPQEHYNPFLGPHGPRYFYSRLVPELRDGQVATVLAIARDITELQQTQTETLRLQRELTQRTADQYHTLFHTMDQGFCVLEILFDEAGQQALDFRYLALNPVFVQQSGLPEGAQGSTARELLPNLEPFWFDTYGRVARTGEPVRVEHYVPQVSRWFDVQAFRLGAPGAHHVAVLFSDITARKRREADLGFLADVSQELVGLTSIAETMASLSHKIGVYFGVPRVHLAAIDEAAQTAVVTHEWHAADLPDLVDQRVHRLGDFVTDAFQRAARAEEILIICNTRTDARTDDAAYARQGIRAFVTAPYVRNGQWLALLSISDAAPRDWPAGDVDLLRELTARIWTRLERARAEEALARSEEKYRVLFDSINEGFATLEVLFDAAGQATDYRILELNQAYEKMTGMPPTVVGRRVRELVPDVEAAMVRRYGEVVRTGEPIRYEQHVAGLGRWFDVYAYPLDGPAPHRVALLFTNITARKQAEEALRLAQESHRQELEQQVAARTQELQQSRHLLQTVFDASPTAIVVMRILRDAASRPEDFEILIFNEFNKQVVGRDDIVGQRFTAMFPQTVPTGILARLLAVATTGEPADFEQWYDGEGMQHWFRHIVVRQDGLLVLTSEVITPRKQAEQERTRNLRLLEQAEAVAGLGSWDFDLLSGQFLWSEGMYQLFGLPLGQAIAPGIYLGYVVAEDRPQAERLVHCLTTGSDCFEETLRLRVGEQVKTVRVKSVVLHDEAGQPARVLGVDLDISELHRLEADNLRLRLTQQQALFEAVQAAQEEERRRMAESLHNGIGQLLYATKLRLDQLHAPVLHTLPALAAARNEADKLLGEAIRQTRTLSHELVPVVLEEFGLAAALRDIAGKMSTPQLRLRSHVLLDEAAAPLAPALQMALYRMAQELAQNIVKHALGATEASLELETMPGAVLLRAEDNGPGFGSANRPGLGLRSIRDRVALLRGQVETGTVPLSGAYVRIRIPLPDFPTL
ncbi:PAS domain-containing protein [Hymenobacter bucti]|uniref:PAS domain-containing protein n=1 Tax=Hymenobacter bucti TaxID=1844114 RepID=A0ABW4QP33_9BACT